MENILSFHYSWVLFILSRWLNKWKKKFGYDCEPNYSITLDSLNSDIYVKPKCVLKLDPMDSHPWNIRLKPNLTEGTDYVIVD